MASATLSSYRLQPQGYKAGAPCNAFANFNSYPGGSAMQKPLGIGGGLRAALASALFALLFLKKQEGDIEENQPKVPSTKIT